MYGSIVWLFIVEYFQHGEKSIYYCEVFMSNFIRFPRIQERIKRGKWLHLKENGRWKYYCVTWCLDGWNQYVYESQDSNIKHSTYSAKAKAHTVKKIIFTDAQGAPIFVSKSYVGRPHDMQLVKFPEVKDFLLQLNKETYETNEFGLGDNAFSAIENSLVRNFLWSPRLDSTENYHKANHMGSVRHVVENINADLESFRALRDPLRVSPTNSLNDMLNEHHHMTIIVLVIIKETQHKFPLNVTNAPPKLAQHL